MSALESYLSLLDLTEPTLDMTLPQYFQNSVPQWPRTAVGRRGSAPTLAAPAPAPASAPEPSPVTMQVTWPRSRIPVEIFEAIASFLPRAEAKKLRLVCKEFETNVSAQHFKNVVVPFRSELYSDMNRDERGNLINSTAKLFSNGMRIFEEFGPHILRFALSLEIDEDALSYPPIKPTQKAVPAFWGIYRWPHEYYYRYTELEGLEQTADEINGMKVALNCLTKVNNLGLCCDPGLGFLLGPDRVARSQRSASQFPVFATRNWRHDSRGPAPEAPIITVADFNNVTRSVAHSSAANQAKFKHRVLENMIREAGYDDSQREEAIQILLDTEGTSLQKVDFDERSTTVNPHERDPRQREEDLRLLFARTLSVAPTNSVERWPLVPTNLTRAQKELLLELEWAHRAMIQSFVICLIDNALTARFDNLSTLTIAKIPSIHLYTLNRHDVWNTLPGLRNVSLGVVADWRQVTKSDLGVIEDAAISPIGAIGSVYKLLHAFLGASPKIESLHFEWICGGELAPSRYQRNLYILPAPFVSHAHLMSFPGAAIEEQNQVLDLPDVKHLSLKNCWVSPHVFLGTIRQMANSSLEKLELESVSLSGPPTGTPGSSDPQPAPPVNAAVLNAQNPFNTVISTGPVMPGADPNSAASWIQAPVLPIVPPNAQGLPGNVLSWGAPTGPDAEPQQTEWSSWPWMIDHFSPWARMRHVYQQSSRDAKAARLDRLEAMSKYVPSARGVHRLEGLSKLKHISFKSCGYVGVQTSSLATSAIAANGGHVAPEFPSSAGPRTLAPFMQSCIHPLLGTIMPFVRPVEMRELERAFDMEFGWEGVYDRDLIQDALNDGIETPGKGRFSGVLDDGPKVARESCEAAMMAATDSDSDDDLVAV